MFQVGDWEKLAELAAHSLAPLGVHASLAGGKVANNILCLVIHDDKK